MKGAEFEKSFGVKTLPYPNYEYIGWNTSIRDQPDRSFFADKRVRWAMSYLVDVPELIQSVMYGQGKPLTSLVFYERPEFNAEIEAVPYNAEKAKALLYEAGWDDLDGNGTLEKQINGKIVPFSFKMYFRQGNETRKNIALLLQEKFKKAGIEMEPVALDWSVMQERLKRHELDSWILAWVFDSNEQDYYQIFHSSQASNEGFNWTQYQNSECDVLMEQIQMEFDTQRRFEMHKKVQKLVYEDQPYTLLFGNMARIVYNKRIETANWYGQRPCYDLPQFTLAVPQKP